MANDMSYQPLRPRRTNKYGQNDNWNIRLKKGADEAKINFNIVNRKLLVTLDFFGYLSHTHVLKIIIKNILSLTKIQMVSLKAFATILFGVNLLTVILLGITNSSGNLTTAKNLRSVQALDEFWYEPTAGKVYRFDDPAMAFTLLEKLDIFSGVEDNEIQANYSRSAGGFKINNNYCSHHRAYLVTHPEVIFGQQNFITNYWHRHNLRKAVMPRIGAKDLHPEVAPRREIYQPQYKFDMSLDATMFYTHNFLYYSKRIGQQFSCLSQASNHIPGHDSMYRKDKNAAALVKYANSYSDRPQCFGFDKYFLRTFILSQKDQCEKFFAEFNSLYYQELKAERNVVYFRKIGADAHEGTGVFPVTEDEEAYIRKAYKNGELCGKNKANNLIQYNIYNPLLTENRKFGLRVFLLVASTNPLIAYYHDGYLRLSIDPYDPKSKDKTTFVTNIGVSLDGVKKDSFLEGLTEAEIQEYTCWFLEKLQDYLLEKGTIQDPNWLDNYLRPQLKKAMIHLLRMSQSDFSKKSSLFEFFGIDFVLDENLGVWFIEANAMPLIDGFTDSTTKKLNQIMVDVFEIVYGLLRSRMKRVVEYVNKLNKEIVNSGITEVSDLSQRRAEFRELSMNKFEPEFIPRAGNGFVKIVDENELGTNRYSGLLEASCF